MKTYFFDFLAFEPFWNKISLGKFKQKSTSPLPYELRYKKKGNVFQDLKDLLELLPAKLFSLVKLFCSFVSSRPKKWDNLSMEDRKREGKGEQCGCIERLVVTPGLFSLLSLQVKFPYSPADQPT